MCGSVFFSRQSDKKEEESMDIEDDSAPSRKEHSGKPKPQPLLCPLMEVLVKYLTIVW